MSVQGCPQPYTHLRTYTEIHGSQILFANFLQPLCGIDGQSGEDNMNTISPLLDMVAINVVWTESIGQGEEKFLFFLPFFQPKHKVKWVDMVVNETCWSLRWGPFSPPLISDEQATHRHVYSTSFVLLRGLLLLLTRTSSEQELFFQIKLSTKLLQARFSVRLL